eukprot:TRINITY_DN2732_c0_g1_i2.p1 TRINITY_DN2732_c0_g1~~TRINITY_DN2732_c0_g1_i2.p1  ORF type:complete len:446 (-),score=161.00 TRINITY_DN2732_c0_g1_i2:59-1396(-)
MQRKGVLSTLATVALVAALATVLVPQNSEAASSDYIPPTAVHTSFGGSPSEIYVVWHTSLPTPDQTVWYGTSSSNLNLVATGSSFSVIASSGYENTVKLTGLTPSTKYYFQVGSKQTGIGQTWSFVTAPPTGKYVPFTVAMYGDMGVTESVHTVNQINALVSSKKTVDWVYHVGDIGYGDDYAADLYDVMWNMWFEYLQPSMGAAQYMVCPGNHEYSCEHSDCNPYSQNFTFYNAKFKMPSVESGSPSTSSMFFSFDYSNTHFVSISTETDYPGAPYNPVFGDQLTWLDQDLQKARQNPNTKWIVVVGHRPIYSSHGDQSDGSFPIEYASKIQSAFEDTFYKYHVDLFVVGHVHSYERTYPVYKDLNIEKSYNNPKYTTYIVVGCAGNKEGLEDLTRNVTAKWSAKQYWQDQGYGILNVTDTQLAWNFYRSTDGTLEDSFVITKN